MMRKQTPVSKQIYSLLPTDVEGFDSLAELALDVKVARDGGNHVFEVQVYLSGLDPNTVRVEL